MRKAVFIGIAALAALGCLLASQRGDAEVVDEGFDSKFVLVLPKSDRKSTTVLKRPTCKVKCHGHFLVGECGMEPGDWRAGKTVWIAVADIAEIVEVKSADEFTKPEPKEIEPPAPPVLAPTKKQKAK